MRKIIRKVLNVLLLMVSGFFTVGGCFLIGNQSDYPNGIAFVMIGVMLLGIALVLEGGK
jgi:hypothetical protein